MRLLAHDRNMLDLARKLKIKNPVIYKKRGKHPRLVGTFFGRKIKYPYPGSPSDHRSMKNNLSQLKRYLHNIRLQINPA